MEKNIYALNIYGVLYTLTKSEGIMAKKKINASCIVMDWALQ